MSIPVDLADLAAQIERFGPCAFLVTTAADGPPHIASVAVQGTGERLTMGAGRRTRANAAQRPAVSLVWSSPVDPDHCLIVDARVPDPAADPFVVAPTSAILHRLASPSAESSASS